MVSGYAVDVIIAGTTVDRCRVLLPLSIRHGRSNVRVQPDAPTATFSVMGSDAPAALGDSVLIESPGAPGGRWTDPRIWWSDLTWTWLGAQGRSRRFTGVVAGMQAVEVEGVVVRYDIECIGTQAALGRVRVQLTRPAESDVARVQAIASAAGTAITVAGQPGVTLRADTIDKDALGALHEVCASSGGLLWQDRDGFLHYGTMEHRDVPAEFVLPCSVILDGLSWTNRTDDVINHVTAKWREGEVERQRTYSDPASIARWGYRHEDVTTLCASETDAGTLGLLILARRKQPFWVMPGVVVLAEEASQAELHQVEQIEVSDGAVVPVETTPTPTPGNATTWTVEGWVETFDTSGHRFQFALSDRLRSESTGTRSWAEARDAGSWTYWKSRPWIEQMVEV